MMPAFSAQTWKVAGVCLGLLVLLGAVLFGIHSCGTYLDNRGVSKARANVNAALQQVNAQKAVIANDRVDEAVAIDHVKQAANDVITASNATDQAKAEANAAVANYVQAKQANVPTGTTEADLQRKLEALDR